MSTTTKRRAVVSYENMNDEVAAAFAEKYPKGYADYFPEKNPPKDVKKVGNSIKSKKMPSYIAKFLENGIRLLLQKRGQDFIEEYYDNFTAEEEYVHF